MYKQLALSELCSLVLYVKNLAVGAAIQMKDCASENEMSYYQVLPLSYSSQCSKLVEVSN